MTKFTITGDGCKRTWMQNQNWMYQIQGRMNKLHESQIKAYREAAVQSIKEWALAFPLQPMEEGDSKLTFVNRCTASLAKATGAQALPNWKLGSAKATALIEIRKRANATYDRYHPAGESTSDEKENEKAATENSETAKKADGPSGGVTAEEDGELTGDDCDISDQGTESANKKKTGRYVHPNKKTAKFGAAKNTVAHKKGNNAKGGFRNNKGGRGSRRGGRGGGNRN